MHTHVELSVLIDILLCVLLVLLHMFKCRLAESLVLAFYYYVQAGVTEYYFSIRHKSIVDLGRGHQAELVFLLFFFSLTLGLAFN